MTTIQYTDAEGTTRLIEAKIGDSVMETAVRNGVPGIVAECGGSLSCATCHILLDEEQDPAQLAELPEMSDMEDEMLYGTACDRQDNSRLSCQIPVTEGMALAVTTPETQV
ncbi:2Fe-2S iron-sulfur cluster-binding protein [Corynebacterium comes]|uniref:Rhodocoxin n=1 Tax=Corynebacterium comes TaxID=2675218 RepID=A0A6B8VVC8_9CORY|nr:2Fe-2S iron-sulfur cluster-binding protein [Corynebacterium comes]QGU05304.1 Rhodocoxin [Corynebacterium comes]